MKSILQHLPPNVIAGTNFNVQRFNELYTWMEACRADALFLNQQDYGLRCDLAGQPNFQLRLEGKQIFLFQALGNTQSGVLFGIKPELSGALQLNIQGINSTSNDIYLVPELETQRQAVGVPDQNEIPLRAPYSVLAFRLEVHPVGTFPKAAAGFKVGILNKVEDNFELQSYLPACAELGAHPLLWEKTVDYIDKLQKFYEALISIVHKIKSAYDAPEIMALNRFCLDVGGHLAVQMPRLKRITCRSSPTTIFNDLQSLASLIDFMWQTNRQHTEFTELIIYNARNSINNFQKETATTLANHHCQPEDLQTTLTLIDSFMQEFILPFIVISNQSKIMEKGKRHNWDVQRNNNYHFEPAKPKNNGKTNRNTW